MTTAIFIATWFPLVYKVFAIIGLYFLLNNKTENKLSGVIKYIFLLLIVKMAYLLYLSILQHFVWSGDGMTRLFLIQPVTDVVAGSDFFNWLGHLFGGELGYFLFYCFGRFWLNTFIVLICSVLALTVIYLIGKFLLKKSWGELVYPISVIAGFIIIGWPELLIYLLILAILAIFISFISFSKLIRYFPQLIIIAICFSAIFGKYLINLLGMGVLGV